MVDLLLGPEVQDEVNCQFVGLLIAASPVMEYAECYNHQQIQNLILCYLLHSDLCHSRFYLFFILVKVSLLVTLILSCVLSCFFGWAYVSSSEMGDT